MHSLKTLIMGAFFALFAVTANAQENPMQKVDEGVYHFFNQGYSSLVAIGENGVLITDPSFDTRADIMAAEIKKITDKPVTHIVLSHEHFDHLGGTEKFPGAAIIMQQKGVDFLAHSPLIKMPTVSETFDKEMKIDLGGKTVELFHIAPGDGVATVVGRVVENNVSFSKDLYMPKYIIPSQFKEDTNFVGVRKILNTMVEWNPTYAINGHSNGNSVEALKENAILVNTIYDRVAPEVKAVIDAGNRGDMWKLMTGITEKVKMEEYSDWKNYEKAMPGYVRRMALSIFHGG